jgi:hypothetical protein
MKGSSGLALLSTLAVIGLVGRVAFEKRLSSPRLRVATATVMSDAGGDAAKAMAAAPSTAQQGATTPAAPAAALATTTPVTPAPVSPLVPQGQSSLPDSLLAMRADSVITVSFDRTMIRTRNPWKFERLVRSTLPALYGPLADSALARIPEGGLVRQGDLINELPTRGMRIPVAPGWTFTLFPITRPGQDGPLVTQYRVSVVRG